ncbi:biotin transporter BioY [Francisella sp. 19S2-10]|uniref:biotin transporter BioY n=1 Tax=Francisella sp. 19S2-10 TaxID=3087176 RepID=UPI002E3346A1|nr:biotin transporter BioY [Francisella sp. 19S2-10]MED7829580.1 biotin transporter BioY [Francisella sp. 19S2-10]
MLDLKALYFLISLLLLIIFSKISFNLGRSIPITLQTYAIGLIILFAPAEIVLMSIFIYVILGAIGLPVFSDNSKGMHVLYGPTGGYIIGFLITAILFYFLKKNFYFLDNDILLIFIWMLLIHFIIITCGFIRLIFLIEFREAFYNGIVALILPAIIKSLALTLTFIIVKYLFLS